MCLIHERVVALENEINKTTSGNYGFTVREHSEDDPSSIEPSNSKMVISNNHLAPIYYMCVNIYPNAASMIRA